MGLDPFQLVDLAILIGTDYFKGIKKIGPKTALSLIKKYGNIETIKRKESNNYNFQGVNRCIEGDPASKDGQPAV